jgi:hypothetical protein
MKMQTGIFRGIEKGIMNIEYETTVFVNHGDGPDENGNWADLKKETRIFSYPVAGKIQAVSWHFGQDKAGWPYDAHPAIGQAVQYDGPAPDMAGHMMVDVYPAGVA